ncbi:MAG: hypothetical protein WC099_02630 [Candidatus Paceibacterota bacterium]
MDSLLQANIFFFIASVATVILTILAGVALWHISRVAKNIHLVSNTIREEMTTIVSHVTGTRKHIEDVLFSLKDAIMEKISGTQTTKKKSTKKESK